MKSAYLTLTLALFTLSLAACGGRPTKTLSEAEGALADARLAEKCAPEEYQAAQRELEKARKFADEKEYDKAQRHAEAAKKLAAKARTKAALRKDECEKEGLKDTPAIDPNDFIDKSGVGTAEAGSSEGLKTIYFDYNAADLTPEGREILGKNAAFLRTRPTVRISIEGHCDKRGSTEYNLALGEKRALMVRTYLGSLGIDADRLAVISYGEEKPLDLGEADGAHSGNRRAEFVIR